MNEIRRLATTTSELVEALQSAENTAIEVRGRLDGAPSLRLKPGQKLSGAPEALVGFASGDDGLIVSSDCSVEHIELRADPDRTAVSNDTDAPGFGRLVLRDLRTTGGVRLIAEKETTGGHVEARDVHVVQADTRAFEDRPAAFGVSVNLGAFTLWNRQGSSDAIVSADLRGIAIGGAQTPVRGTGVLVGGTAGGGRLVVSLLETGAVYSDGGIAAGTADLIGGGVFVLQGSEIDEVRNLGPVTTFGANDMVLDNWGTVERWNAQAKISSYGPAGIGFVNLGALGTLTIDALVETHGLGACGFNCGEYKEDAAKPAGGSPPVYDGTVRVATFERVVTRGDGAVGIQVAVPIGRMLVRSGVETFGGVGASLARGMVMQLPAVALSVKPGGALAELTIEDGLTTHGEGIEALELHGRIDRVRITGSVGPTGGGF